ncbi:MAG: hypothetical protein GXO23_01055 [Crenarchaeota archaeon]|nr:hypothetical protein [Thermoproteota archaeon]
MSHGRVEKMLENFLSKLLRDILARPDVQGRWLLYVPHEDRYELFDSRDEAIRYVYKKLRNVDVVILVQIPLSSEESYAAFARMLSSSHK